jgi:hypothetical protein
VDCAQARETARVEECRVAREIAVRRCQRAESGIRCKAARAVRGPRRTISPIKVMSFSSAESKSSRADDLTSAMSRLLSAEAGSFGARDVNVAVLDDGGAEHAVGSFLRVMDLVCG